MTPNSEKENFKFSERKARNAFQAPGRSFVARTNR